MSDYRRLSRCGIEGCKQTLYTLENGQWFCKNGHLREGELDIEAEDADYGRVGARATRIETIVKKQSKLLRGRKGFELYIQCYQLILQKQVWFLVHTKGFPPEIEALVHDLWALRLQVLSVSMDKRSSSQAGSQSNTGGGGDSQGAESGNESQSSYVHTTSGEESVGSSRSGPRKRRRKKTRLPKTAERPKLLQTVVLCYLAALMLRLPVCLGDMHRWVEAGEMPYLRAIREVPAEMRTKLSGEYWISLEPRGGLKKGKLYQAVQETVCAFHDQFGITFPPVNSELLLGRFVNELGLPLEIYSATKTLSDHLCQSFAWANMTKQARSSLWPESRLMAVTIMATKLCFGLDSVKRTPKSSDEPAATPLSWTAWEKFLKEGDIDRGGGLELDVAEADVFQMDDDDMDRYMDWFEKTWCPQDDSEIRTNLTSGILNLFPTSRPKPQNQQAHQTQQPEQTQQTQQTQPSQPSQPSQELPSPFEAAEEAETAPTALETRLQALHSSAHRITPNPAATPPKKPRRRPRDPVSSSEDEPRPIRPGEKYLFSSTEEALPKQLKTMMQAAADLLGVERKDLQLAIRNLETMLREGVKGKRQADRRKEKEAKYMAWEDQQRRDQQGSEGNDSEEGEEEEYEDAQEAPPPRPGSVLETDRPQLANRKIERAIMEENPIED